jgi:hypothetical protein
MKKQMMTAEEFAKGHPILTGQPSMLHAGKTLNPLAPWQIAVACQFAQAYYQYRASQNDKFEQEAYKQMRTCINALYLEVEPSIADDILKHFEQYRASQNESLHPV